LDLTRINDLLAAFTRKRILVAGDFMLDEFVWGRVSRISPEAPVPVVEVMSESAYPGGAANVARNLREFTGNVTLAGIIGDDSAGARLMGLLDERGIDSSGLMRSASDHTVVKTRVIARQQQVVRVDRDSRATVTADILERLRLDLERRIDSLDAIIFADYGKGFLTQAVVDMIAGIARPRGVLMVVDPNPNNQIAWSRMTAIKPNRVETIAAAGHAVDLDTADALEQAARGLQTKWDTSVLLITLGEQGMWLFERGERPYHTAARAKEVFDVSGAGDTAIALFTLALAAGAAPREAAEVANAASSVVVGKLGTATLTPAELSEALLRRE
jgi:D-glycero-beta-D-manno-heptose-7-phosphate kinase